MVSWTHGPLTHIYMEYGGVISLDWLIKHYFFWEMFFDPTGLDFCAKWEFRLSMMCYLLFIQLDWWEWALLLYLLWLTSLSYMSTVPLVFGLSTLQAKMLPRIYPNIKVDLFALSWTCKTLHIEKTLTCISAALLQIACFFVVFLVEVEWFVIIYQSLRF